MTDQGKYRLRLLLVAMALIASGSGYVYSYRDISAFTFIFVFIFLITILLLVVMLVMERGRYVQPKPKDNGQEQPVVYRYIPPDPSRSYFDSVSTKEIVNRIMVRVLSKYTNPQDGKDVAPTSASPIYKSNKDRVYRLLELGPKSVAELSVALDLSESSIQRTLQQSKGVFENVGDGKWSLVRASRNWQLEVGK